MKQTINIVRTAVALGLAATTVAAFAAGTIRVNNNSQFALVDLRVDNVQRLAANQFALPGQFFTVSANAGTRQVFSGIGFKNNGIADVLFTNRATVNVLNNQTVTVNVPRVTARQVLSGFKASTDWRGQYFRANNTVGYATFRIFSSGFWQLYDGNAMINSGTLAEVSWPNMSTFCTFRFNAAWQTNITRPYASFMLRNGPASWPVIQYTRIN